MNVKTVNKCKHVHGAMEMHFMKHTSYSFNITSKNTTVIPTWNFLFNIFFSYQYISVLSFSMWPFFFNKTSAGPEVNDFLTDKAIWLFRIISIPSKFCYFRPPDHMISMECSSLDFRCQCTQQNLQSTCAVLAFDPQLKKILIFSVKDRYQLNYFICIKDFNAETITSLKLNLFSFFICCCQPHERKTICL